MTKFLLFIFILITKASFCQTGIIKDSITNDPIPYVNIWFENENIGTTSEENGKFNLPIFKNDKYLIFSAIGYKTKRVNTSLTNYDIKLIPNVTELSEIVLNIKKQTLQTIIGQINKSQINFYFGCGLKPWITARFFKFNENYKETPFLKTIQFLTRSDIKDSKFNVRLYSVNEKGEPENYIYDQNIFGIAKKGKKITEIDISNLNIQFPENGFFIAVEWLIIDQNKYENKSLQENSKKKYNRISYEPAFGIEPSESNENSWIFNQGKWQKIWKHRANSKNYIDKYDLLTLELTLTD